MESEKSFFRTVMALAVPVALQSMLQSSFGMVDQIMIGQLGSVSVAGVGLAGKFSSIFSVVSSAVGAAAGIMIAQYIGQRDRREVRRSFYVNLWVVFALAAVFTALCALWPKAILSLYTADPATRDEGAAYLAIIAGTYLPMAGATLLSALLRCVGEAKLPLYASLASALLNTGLNWLLIFGKLGLAAMGVRGAAIATVVSQWGNCLVMLCLARRRGALPSAVRGEKDPPFARRQYLAMLLPILACELLWSLGENVYAAIYGRMGTEAAAAMSLTNPVQGLVIGALCGLSQAAGVLVGQRLGEREYDAAYREAKKLLWYGLAGAAVLSVLVVAVSPFYVKLYRVEQAVCRLTRQILIAYALVAPLKLLNMILGGGVIRSGGRTGYVMAVDIIGTWGFGVPLGLLGAFVLRWSIPYVYFLLSLEEGVRLAISFVIFRRKNWMHSLSGSQSTP